MVKNRDSFIVKIVHLIPLCVRIQRSLYFGENYCNPVSLQVRTHVVMTMVAAHTSASFPLEETPTSVIAQLFSSWLQTRGPALLTAH